MTPLKIGNFPLHSWFFTLRRAINGKKGAQALFSEKQRRTEGFFIFLYFITLPLFLDFFFYKRKTTCFSYWALAFRDADHSHSLLITTLVWGIP